MRDQMMSVMFGAGPIMDAFTVAFRLPNLARVLLGEGALTTAFLPVFVAEMHERGRQSAARVTWAVFFALIAVFSVVILICEGSLWFVAAFADLSAEARLLVNLIAILLPYVVLICLAAQISAVLNALGQFLWPALVPAVLNTVWLLTLWKIVPLWSDEVSRIYVTATCVLLGGGLQLLFPMPTLYRHGFGYRSDWRSAIDRVWTIAGNMLPVVVGLSVTQLNSVLDSFIAWGFTRHEAADSLTWLPGSPSYPLCEGTATALYLGQRLYQFPLGVFGVALGTVLFPLLTAHAQRGDLDKLRADLSLGIRLVAAICLPASAGLMLIGHPLATLFFQYGKFDADAARLTGDMIIAYGSGVWAYCGLLILQRGFYAVGDRLTPMYIGLAAMGVNAVMDVSLIWPLAGRGLALSTALVAALQCLATVTLLQQKIGTLLWREIGITTWKTFVATGTMALAYFATVEFLRSRDDVSGRLIRVGAPFAVATASFLGTTWLVKLNEPWQLLAGRRQFADGTHAPIEEESGSNGG